MIYKYRKLAEVKRTREERGRGDDREGSETIDIMVRDGGTLVGKRKLYIHFIHYKQKTRT